MDSKSRKFLIILAAAIVPFAIVMVLLLTAAFGTPNIGVRCTRQDSVAGCEVLQERFFGLLHPSPVVIPETEISGASMAAPQPHAGRGSGEYSISLVLRHGAYPTYAVMHSKFQSRAQEATRRLNDYFADPSARSIELRESSSEILYFLVPLALVVVVVAVIAARRSKPAP